MEYYHTATKERISELEIQRRLDKHFDFKCNDCGEIIGNHLKVLAEGIFCVGCFNKLMDELTDGEGE